MEGPIGMAEEKDSAQVQEELERLEARGGDKPMGAPGPKGASADGSSVKLRPSGKQDEENEQDGQSKQADDKRGDADGKVDSKDESAEHRDGGKDDSRKTDGRKDDGGKDDGKRPPDKDLGPAAGTRDDLPGVDEEVPADIASEVAAIQAERVDVEKSGGGQPLEPRSAFDPETGQQRRRPSEMSDEEYEEVFDRKEANEAKPEGAGADAAENVRKDAESRRDSSDSDQSDSD